MIVKRHLFCINIIWPMMDLYFNNFRLLSRLSEPIDDEEMIGCGMTDIVRHDIYKLSRQVRNAFLDMRVVSRLFEQLHELIDEVRMKNLVVVGSGKKPQILTVTYNAASKCVFDRFVTSKYLALSVQ